MIKIHTIIILTTFLAIYIFNKILVKYSNQILHVKGGVVFNFVPLAASLISIVLIYRKTYTPVLYSILFISYMILFYMVYEESLSEIYVIVINQMFFLILFRDITVSILSIASHTSTYDIMNTFETYMLSFALCRLFMIIMVFHFDMICSLEMAKKLVLNRKKLKMSDLAVLCLIILLLNSNQIHYYSINSSDFNWIFFVNRICIAFCFYFSVKMKTKTIRWVEEEVLYKTTTVRLEQNAKRNKEKDEYGEQLKRYNHDFKHVLFHIKDSLENGDIEQAQSIINQFDDKIQCISNSNKRYANRPFINSLLNRLKEECEEHGICLDADCYIPSDIRLLEIDLISIFSNLSANACEACQKQPASEKRWITFKSYVKDDFFIIYQANSFNGEIKFKKDRLITTKEDKKAHGIGVGNIKFIVENANGISMIKVDKEKKEFKFLIRIPRG